ncbi:sensor histidine kinase [Micropruina sp.]|uniref:sensor histidine kinase n=1 Tax=Micropruina sp. TaxID=2737536 RepID=UPI0039E6960F
MRLLNSGWFEVALSVLLATLAVILDLSSGHTATATLDVTACVVAASTARWPRAGAATLGAVLAAYLLVPREWVTIGEYAALIPILSTGMRDATRLRALISVAYLIILTLIQHHDYPERGALFLLAGLAWAVLIAVCWILGTMFSTLTRTQAAAQREALTRQRLTVARDLHDTVARTLTHLSLTAKTARETGDPADLEAVIDGVHHVANELRWVMSVLSDPSQPSTATGPATAQLQATVDALQTTLTKHGFPTTVTLEGNGLDNIPQPIQQALNSVLAEAAANIERHATRHRPCAILGVIDPAEVQFLVINERDPSQTTAGTRMGLAGMREILAPHSGKIETRQEDTRWTLHVIVPLIRERPGSSSSTTTYTSEPA